MAIEAVIFDIGNVLVEWQPARPFDRLLGQARREELFRRVDFAAMNVRVDLGADIAAEVRALAEAHPEDARDILIWHECWLEMLQPDLPDTAALLRGLRAGGVAVHALSNFGAGTFELAERHYPVLAEFDRHFISGRLGVMKPDPAIYAHVEAELGLAPGAMLFTDDRHENIAAAADRGWQTHLFEGPGGLRDRLVVEGLLAGSAP